MNERIKTNSYKKQEIEEKCKILVAKRQTLLSGNANRANIDENEDKLLTHIRIHQYYAEIIEKVWGIPPDLQNPTYNHATDKSGRKH